MMAAVAHPLFVVKVYFTEEVKIAGQALSRLIYLVTTFGEAMPLGVVNTLEDPNLYVVQHSFLSIALLFSSPFSPSSQLS